MMLLRYISSTIDVVGDFFIFCIYNFSVFYGVSLRNNAAADAAKC